VAGILVAGVGLGAALSGAPSAIVLGTIAVLLAIAAAVYSPALGLGVFALSYPFDLTTYAGPLKLTTSQALLLILVAVMVGRHFLRNPPPIHRTSLDLPVALFGAATVLSLLGLAGFYSDQLVALVKAGGGFLVFFIVTQGLRERREPWLAITGVLGAGLLLSLMAVVPILQGTVSISDQNRLTAINVVDPNLFAGYLVILIPLALAAGLAMRWSWAPVAAGVALLILGAAVLATLSRGGWLGFVVGVVTMAVLLPGRRRVILGIAGAVVLILLIGGLAGPVAARLGNGAGASPIQTLVDRVPIWSAAITLWLQHPVFGIGLDNFNNYILTLNPDLDVNQAHDLFLNVLVERGILGLITFGFFLFMVFRALGRSLQLATASSQRILAAGIAAGFLAFLADSLFDVAYYDYKVLLLFWLLAGVAASLPRLFATPTLADGSV
jgi:O-antigen ligase